MRHVLTSLSLAIGIVVLADQASAKVIKFEVVQIEFAGLRGPQVRLGRDV